MSSFYNPQRTKNLFEKNSDNPFNISRSKIELFMQCPLCFYLDRKKGISRPSTPPFTLNTAVDKLLKKEFDIHRAKNIAHPLMKAYGINAIPFFHEELDEWRENFKGIKYLHEPTNLLISGAVDDIWINLSGELCVVDYKATSKEGEIDLETSQWKEQYKRQIEIYQWLLRKNNFKVSNTGYLVYLNGKTDKEAFDGKLEFDVKIIPVEGDDSWVEEIIFEIYNCLMSDNYPLPSPTCNFCAYRNAIIQVMNN